MPDPTPDTGDGLGLPHIINGPGGDFTVARDGDGKVMETVTLSSHLCAAMIENIIASNARLQAENAALRAKIARLQ